MNSRQSSGDPDIEDGQFCFQSVLLTPVELHLQVEFMPVENKGAELIRETWVRNNYSSRISRLKKRKGRVSFHEREV